MSFDWRSLVDFARRLESEANVDSANAETLRRSAIGRAYYGAFCCVRNYAASNLGFRIQKGADDHGRLRSHLKGKWSGLARRLERLRNLRNEADYSDDLPWDDTKVVAAEAIQVAVKVLALVPQASPGSGS